MNENKTYYPKENAKFYIGLGLIALLFWGFASYHAITKYAWSIILIAFVSFLKGIMIIKKPLSKGITLDEEGIYLHSSKIKYPYSGIVKIKLVSKYRDGYIILKNKKKIMLYTHAIIIEEQEELQGVVRNKIKGN